MAQRSVKGAVGEPINVGADEAVGVVLNDTVLAHGLAVNEAEQVRTLPAFAHPHMKAVDFPGQNTKTAKKQLYRLSQRGLCHRRGRGESRRQ